MRNNLRTFAAAEIVAGSTLEPLDLGQIFGRVAPLAVDLGCGDGSFLVALAQQNPERNFLGIERLVGRARCAGRKIGEAKVVNARVVQFEILHAVQQLFPRASVDVFYLMFPDPWPKRRHQNRRVFTAEFLRAVSRALEPQGELRVATDRSDYFTEILKVAAQVFAFTPVPNANHATPDSTFEKRFRETGAKIHRLVLRKISELR